MKVLLVNGSPHKGGVTYTALAEAAGALNTKGIETEIYHIGGKAIRGCTACGACSESRRCIFDDDPVNEFVDMAKQADGFIFGAPVYYAAVAGTMTAFLDRVFYSGGQHLAYKPGASVVCARRGGTTAALDQMNKYFTISNMPVVSSQYWNMLHGNTAEEAAQDLEGLQIMRRLGGNMAWLLKCIEAGKANGIGLPHLDEPREKTNFIR